MKHKLTDENKEDILCVLRRQMPRAFVEIDKHIDIEIRYREIYGFSSPEVICTVCSDKKPSGAYVECVLGSSLLLEGERVFLTHLEMVVPSLIEMYKSQLEKQK